MHRQKFVRFFTTIRASFTCSEATCRGCTARRLIQCRRTMRHLHYYQHESLTLISCSSEQTSRIYQSHYNIITLLLIRLYTKTTGPRLVPGPPTSQPFFFPLLPLNLGIKTPKKRYLAEFCPKVSRLVSILFCLYKLEYDKNSSKERKSSTRS